MKKQDPLYFRQLHEDHDTVNIVDWIKYHENGSKLKIVKSDDFTFLYSYEDGSMLMIDDNPLESDE